MVGSHVADETDNPFPEGFLPLLFHCWLRCERSDKVPVRRSCSTVLPTSLTRSELHLSFRQGPLSCLFPFISSADALACSSSSVNYDPVALNGTPELHSSLAKRFQTAPTVGNLETISQSVFRPFSQPRPPIVAPSPCRQIQRHSCRQRPALARRLERRIELLLPDRLLAFLICLHSPYVKHRLLIPLRF